MPTPRTIIIAGLVGAGLALVLTTGYFAIGAGLLVAAYILDKEAE